MGMMTIVEIWFGIGVLMNVEIIYFEGLEKDEIGPAVAVLLAGPAIAIAAVIFKIFDLLNKLPDVLVRPRSERIKRDRSL